MMTLCLCSCTARSSSVIKKDFSEADFEPIETSATGFSIAKNSEGYFYITISDQRILTVPEGKDIPDWAKDEKDVVVLRQPLSDIYVAASSIPDMIDALGKLDAVSFTSTRYEDWAISSMREALDSLSMEYIGKYRAPDYESLLANGCQLAIESTMIYHNPEVKEKLESVGIPVIVDASSYESDPLSRLEWIKVYGAILGCFDEAERIYNEKAEAIEAVKGKAFDDAKRPTVAFFYISTSGSAVVRKPGDYVSKMIDMAGGKYVITSLPEEDNALSTMNMQIENFYAEAIDADILIYNSTIDGEINSIDELIGKCQLLSDFKAVKSGNVYCSGKNMFQQTSAVAEMIEDLSRIINDDGQNLTYFTKLQ